MKSFVNHIIVFLVGGSIMSLEVTGSRVLAPFFGTSVIVWTSLIGLILLSLSIGYAIGGRMADNQPKQSVLTGILFTAAVVVSLIGLLKGAVLESAQMLSGHPLVSVIAVTLFLFAPASILLAMVSPYAARLEMKSVEKAGKVVGNLNAIGTAGSIVGTFAAGFFLLAVIGNSFLIQLIATVVLGAGLLSLWADNERPKAVVVVVGIILLLIGSSLIFEVAQAKDGPIDIDTRYSRIFVYEDTDPETGRAVRNLVTDGSAIQSSMFIDAPNELAMKYSQFYQLSEYFHPKAVRMAVIGGAAYSYPKYLMARYPEAQVDVVEIDAEMTEVAREHFGLQESNRMSIHHEDGRTFLNTAETGVYDVLFMDAYHSVFVPFQLTTTEAVEQIHRALVDDGVAVVNMISGTDGRQGELLRAQIATYEEWFDYVEVFPVWQPQNREMVQNMILFAFKGEAPSFESDNPEIQKKLNHRLTREIPRDMPVLTDDYAPVDYYILEMFTK